MPDIKAKINKLPKSEVEILLTIPWDEIKQAYDKISEEALKAVEIKGFRKGKAPKKIAEQSIDKSKLLTTVLQKIIPPFYQKTISDNNLKPIINPRISLDSAKENEDWQVKLLFAEKPAVELGSYKDELGKLNKSSSIWVPGKNKKEETDEEKKAREEERIQSIITWLLSHIKIEVSELILEEEINRRLSELIDQTQKVGLTVEQYLASSGKTLDTIKAEYRRQAEETWKLELIMSEVAEKENIIVENKEIDEVINRTEGEKEKKNLETQKYLLASILRRQKTLDFLAKL